MRPGCSEPDPFTQLEDLQLALEINPVSGFPTLLSKVGAFWEGSLGNS